MCDPVKVFVLGGAGFLGYYTVLELLRREHVAEAIAGAVERGKGGETYTVGDENLTWTEMLKSLSRLAGREKRVISIPNFIARAAMWSLHLLHGLKGREGGINPAAFAAIQTANTFFDPSPSLKALGYGSGRLEKALRETVEATERNP